MMFKNLLTPTYNVVYFNGMQYLLIVSTFGWAEKYLQVCWAPLLGATSVKNYIHMDGSNIN